MLDILMDAEYPDGCSTERHVKKFKFFSGSTVTQITLWIEIITKDEEINGRLLLGINDFDSNAFNFDYISILQ